MSKTFSTRLRRACDTSEREELRGYGRQALIARTLDVSEETVRKWFAGVMAPRPEKMRKLAKFLGVELTWLALGQDPEMDAKQTKVLTRNVQGAVLYVRGLIQLAGGVTADPSAKDTKSGIVDFYAVLDGVHQAIHVSFGNETDEGYVIPVPAEHAELRVLAVVPYRANYLVLDMPSEMIDKHRFRKGGDFAVRVERAEGGGFITDGEEWPRLRPGSLPAAH